MKTPQSTLPIVIFGCGGHGRVVADTLRVGRAIVAGFLDDRPPASFINGIPVLGDSRCLERSDFLMTYAIIVAIGNVRVRRRFATLVLGRGGNLGTAIHNKAVIAQDVTIGDGSVIMAGAVINTGSRIGRFAIINTGATLDHDNLMEDGVHICPGCHLAGNVTCGADAFVGTGASVIPGVRIGARAVIGAGAAVTSDIPPDALAVGCPAMVKKRYHDLR
jgi:sugar O-acyltransferase (sialic acid O-acetyltransferase NeuD family)